MMKIAPIVLAVAVAILAGFYGGYKFEQTNASASTGSSGQRATGGGQGGFGALAACGTPSPRPSSTGGNQRGRGASGTVTAVDNGTLTVHDARCNTDVKVSFSSTVIVRKTISGQASDLQENEIVTVQGQAQPDGSVKATSITILPAGSTLPGRRGQSPAPGD